MSEVAAGGSGVAVGWQYCPHKWPGWGGSTAPTSGLDGVAMLPPLVAGEWAGAVRGQWGSVSVRPQGFDAQVCRQRCRPAPQSSNAYRVYLSFGIIWLLRSSRLWKCPMWDCP